MSMRRFAIIAGGAVLAAALFVPLAHAGTMNQSMFITVQQTVRIPGTILTPGTYYITRIDSGVSADMNTFVVYNQARNFPITIVQTLPVERRDATNRIILTFSESSKGHPPALVEWFYPGELEGHQLVYSSAREKRIEHSPEITLAANSKGDEVVPGVNGRSS